MWPAGGCGPRPPTVLRRRRRAWPSGLPSKPCSAAAQPPSPLPHTPPTPRCRLAGEQEARLGPGQGLRLLHTRDKSPPPTRVPRPAPAAGRRASFYACSETSAGRSSRPRPTLSPARRLRLARACGPAVQGRLSPPIRVAASSAVSAVTKCAKMAGMGRNLGGSAAPAGPTGAPTRSGHDHCGGVRAALRRCVGVRADYGARRNPSRGFTGRNRLDGRLRPAAPRAPAQTRGGAVCGLGGRPCPSTPHRLPAT